MHSTTIGTVPYIGTLTGVIGTMASLGAGSGVSDGGEINGGKGDQCKGGAINVSSSSFTFP
jgi:hypothetical protein